MSFNCRICGKEYGMLPEAMNCERTCYDKQERNKKFQKQKKLKEEQQVRKAELDKAIKEADDKYNIAMELEKKYEKDYCAAVKFNSDGFPIFASMLYDMI